MFNFVLVLVVSLCFLQVSCAREDSGKEHGGKEHGGVKTLKPAADDIRATMKNHVLEKSEESGTFDVYDDKVAKTRRLSLIRVHKRVGKTGDYYYSCADFLDVDTNELLDLDLDVEHSDTGLSVVDVRIHKLNGEERYIYDVNDNRISVER
ncbi:MAG TPA: hypothetical protein ENH41_04480 [Candidatus Omnitrophica bacterium]|nr:hypothetical protein [Candidatus Omnitrophota bacterium]